MGIAGKYKDDCYIDLDTEQLTLQQLKLTRFFPKLETGTFKVFIRVFLIKNKNEVIWVNLTL